MAEAVLLLVIGGIFLVAVLGIWTWANNKKNKAVCEDGQVMPNEAIALKKIYAQVKKTGAIASDVLLADLDWRPKQFDVMIGTLKLKRMIDVDVSGDIQLTEFGKNYCEVFLGC